MVEYEGSDEAAARTAAMQIAAMRPAYVSRDEVPAETVENERRIAEATAKEEGVPAYVVFHDATLRQIAVEQPDTLAAVGAISGIGENKLRKYGQQVLDTLAG